MEIEVSFRAIFVTPLLCRVTESRVQRCYPMYVTVPDMGPFSKHIMEFSAAKCHVLSALVQPLHLYRKVVP
jgi:hypothetical protein